MSMASATGPEISIVVPVYKGVRFLRAALESVKAQTFRDWECVCVDDGSKDGSGALADEIAREDARIRVIRQPNGGTSVARNTALQAVRGRYVAFLDEDDLYHPRMLETLRAAAEATGADVDEVARVMGADHRIGSKFLKAGPGFGGSCFKKDVLNLVYLCESFGLHTAAEYWSGVIKMNDHQQERIVSRLFKAMFNTLANKKIALFGFAFKADTGDTRETPAGYVARLLNEEHVNLVITDPKAIPNAKLDLEDLDSTPTPPTYTSDPYKAAKDADAVVVMTDWKEYAELDWAKIYKSMRKPALVFDTRNCLDVRALKDLGFNVLNIGK